MMAERRTQMLTAEAAIEMWHASRLSVTKPYEMSPEIIKANDSVIGTLGNFSASKPLAVRKNEKVRVCYLINQLSEKIDKETRSEWIGAMLRITGIDQDYYRSKYREPVSDLPSKKNKEFADALTEILA